MIAKIAFFLAFGLKLMFCLNNLNLGCERKMRGNDCFRVDVKIKINPADFKITAYF